MRRVHAAVLALLAWLLAVSAAFGAPAVDPSPTQIGGAGASMICHYDPPSAYTTSPTSRRTTVARSGQLAAGSSWTSTPSRSPGRAAKPATSFIAGENGVVVSASRARIEETRAETVSSLRRW